MSDENPSGGDREEHGFGRTRCSCGYCCVPCRHVPGGLDPADLARLCPDGVDLFTWAEEHLRALTCYPYPTLVPARRADGSCHWFVGGRCAVHEHAPYGCAFFDSHMPDAEADARYAATVRARQDDAAAGGLYFRLWSYLCRRGLVGRPGSKSALAEEVRRLRVGARPIG